MTSASVFPDSDELESELTNRDSANDELTNPESANDDPPVADAPCSVTIPDRADAPVSEITERFFKAIVTKVPVDRIEELHLFAPLRQGGVETGIAVIAARVIVPIALPSAVSDAPLELSLDETDATPLAEDAVESDVVNADDVRNAHAAASPYAPETLHGIVVDATLQSMTEVAQTAAVVERHTVYTARYRLVQKGAERGKWEASVVDEADAPLVTVDLVVRGVQRRAGEASETTRYSGAQIARALRLQQAL